MSGSRALRCVWLAVVVIGGAHRAQASAFFADFNAGLPGEFSGAGAAETVLFFAGLGPSALNVFSGDYLRNETAAPALKTTLTLRDLDPHDTIDLSFLWAAIDSWDSTNGRCCGPDYFQVDVGGINLIQATAANAGGSINTYPAFAKGKNFAQHGGWNDSAFFISTSFLHTSSTLELDFYATGAGWSGGWDESWAIDNLRIDTRCRVGVCATVVVPEPTVLSLAAIAALAAATFARRRG